MSDNDIKILHTHFSSELSNKTWNSYLHKLPEAIQGEIIRYKRWEDRQARLFGKLLLLECLKDRGYPSDYLNYIEFDKYGRPYLEHDIDFSISHSGEYVICAITDAGKLGVDIERIKPIDLSDFERYMTPEQWKKIKEDSNEYKIFYRYWTIKESVLKADGRGLSIPLLEINTDWKKAILFDSVWFLREISIESDYSCYLATNIEHSETCLKKINFGP